MATQIPQPVIHIFNIVNEGKYKGVNHYELIEVKFGTTLLSNKINISEDRKFANSMPDFWLKIREGNKWSKCLTGLFKTYKNNVFKGDIAKKTSLIILKFSDDSRIAIVYYFKNYYTSDLRNLLRAISN